MAVSAGVAETCTDVEYAPLDPVNGLQAAHCVVVAADALGAPNDATTRNVAAVSAAVTPLRRDGLLRAIPRR